MLDSDDIEMLFNSLPDPILICGLDGLIRYCNQQATELLGYTNAELAGQPVEVLVPAAQRPQHGLWRQNYTAAPRLRGMNQLQGIKALRKNGSEVAVTVSLNPVQSPDHEFIIVSLRRSSIDAADQERHSAGKERQLQLQRLESLGLLSCGIAHDIRNMLMVVSGNAELLMSGIPQRHHLQGNVQSIARATDQLNQLSQQILAFAGGQDGLVQKVDLNHVVTEMAQLLKIALPPGIRLETKLAAGLPALDSDPSHLAQLLLNLIMNARDAIDGSDGCIAITTGCMSIEAGQHGGNCMLPAREAGEHLYLQVSDDGHGMTPEQQQRIFDPFYSTRQQGKGLGLSVVQSVALRHGGSICLDSEPGVGTCFTVTLPVQGPLQPATNAAVRNHDRSEDQRRAHD